MATISETGHGINISNYKLLIDKCTGYGAAYAPSNNELKIGSMTTQWDDVKTKHDALITALQQSKVPINEREQLFKGLSKLVTKVNAMVGSIKATASFKKDVKGLADKIRGFKLSTKKLADGTPDPQDVSNSHMSYVMRTENFKSLIDLITTNALYDPAEAGLKITDLNNLYTEMDTMNTQIGTILTPVEQARIARDKGLYNTDNGVLVTAKNCKNYVKGLYGASSAEYKLISGIKFKNIV
jgi:hypothetical protein